MKNYVRIFHDIQAGRIAWNTEAATKIESISNPDVALTLINEMIANELKDSGQTSYSIGDDLKVLLNTLDDKEMRIFLWDILSENEDIELIFPSLKEITSSEYAFDWLIGLPYMTLLRIKEKLESIYVQVIETCYESDTNLTNTTDHEKILRKIHAIVAANRFGLSPTLLTRILDTYQDKLTPLHKVLLIRSLAYLEDSPNENFWDNIARQKDIALIPGVMKYYRNRKSPMKSLMLLKEIDFSQTPIELQFYYISEIELAINETNLTENVDHYYQVMRMSHILPHWINLDKLLGSITKPSTALTADLHEEDRDILSQIRNQSKTGYKSIIRFLHQS
jgi:hypothetical protein